MTLEDLAAKLDAIDAKVETRGAKLDTVAMKLDALGAKVDSLDKKVDEGFKDSKIRDEELRGLMTFGLEARDVLRDEMHRRFDEAARKHEDDLTLLRDIVAPRGGRT